MKLIRHLAVVVLATSFLGNPLTGVAADAKSPVKLKPYVLKTCVVSGDKLGEMGDPYVWEYEGREIKFCCKSCVKDFKKEPAKYLKKIEEGEAKAAK